MFETLFYILGSIAFALYIYRCVKPPKTRPLLFEVDDDGKVKPLVWGSGSGTD